MKNTTPFQSVIDALLDTDKSFPKKYLPLFSDIDPASLRLLQDNWPQIDSARKHNLLAELETLLQHDTIVSFEDLARPLLTDPEAPVRAAAIRLLGECEDKKLIPAYEKILASDPDPAPRAEAANALGLFVALGELEEIPEAAFHHAEEALLACLRGDEIPAIKRRALESLGYSSRADVPPHLDAAYTRQDPEWVTSALIAMGRSCDERWEEPVLNSMLSENHTVREAAVKAAGEIGLESARQPLLQLLNEEEENSVFFSAVWSLSQIGGEDVRDIINALADATEDEDELDFYEEALANLAFAEDIAALDLLALNPDEDLLDLNEDEE